MIIANSNGLGNAGYGGIPHPLYFTPWLGVARMHGIPPWNALLNAPSTQVNYLFVDDEHAILQSLRRLSKRLPGKCFFAPSAKDGLAFLKIEDIHVVVSDLKMPQMGGLEFLAEVARLYPDTIRIVLTGYSEASMILSAINDGHIWGYIEKPWQNQALLVTLQQAANTQELIHERYLLRQQVSQYEALHLESFADFIGESLPMQQVYTLIQHAAPSTAPIFILGESGTGKELASAAVHKYSKRKDRDFIALNCAAIPKDLMESEIFGHIKGAFTGAVSDRAGAAELADGGTLFLDELAEMDIGLQAKLLRFIQTGEYQRVGSGKTQQANIRFVSATNVDPQSAIAAGTLRADLYYRLNVIEIDMPALQQRGWDVVLLAEHFINHYSQLESRQRMTLDDAAQALLQRYAWPGNVRQLQNTIYSLVITHQQEVIDEQALARALKLNPQALVDLPSLEQPLQIAQHSQHSQRLQAVTKAHLTSNPPEPLSDDEILPLIDVERSAVLHAIGHFQGNVVKAAAALGVSPSTIYRKLQQWEIELP